MNFNFRCPKCGGWAFGTIVKSVTPFVVESYDCHSDVHGTPLSMNNEEWEAHQAGAGLPKRGKRCGWKGKFGECFIPTTAPHPMGDATRTAQNRGRPHESDEPPR
jgi:hypothetical protein